jgi:hypothetical protein
MEELAANLHDMKTFGLDDALPDETAEIPTEQFDFTRLTEFISQSQSFWDELLIMQNEVSNAGSAISYRCLGTCKQNSFVVQVPHAGGKIVIEGTIPKAQTMFAAPDVLKDMLGVFDEFEKEIAALQANLFKESSDGDEDGEDQSLHRAESLRSDLSAEDSIPADGGAHVVESTEAPVSPDAAVKVLDKESEEIRPNVVSPSPESSPIMMHSQVASADPHVNEPSTAALRHGSAWDDLDVMQLKATKQVVADSSCLDAYDHSPEGVALRLIASQLEAQALRPINIPRLLTVAAAGASLVAYSAWYAGTSSDIAVQAPALAIAAHPRVLGVLWVAGFAANVAGSLSSSRPTGRSRSGR